MQATETTLQNVLAGTRVFELPYFQRRYRWSADNWEELWEDILEQYDHHDVVAGRLVQNQGHFLGSIVLHPGQGPASTVARYLLVDGQQRITTFLALLAAFRDYRAKSDRTWDPAEYDHQLLTNPFSKAHPYRLVPTPKDREAYRKTLHLGTPTGQIGRAYRFFYGELRRLGARDGGLDFVRFENTVLLRMLIVEITTTPTDDVNHIFHTLNASGENLAPLDLVRNHIFMQVEAERAEACFQMWTRTEAMLGEERMERYIWSQLVRFNPKATQRSIYKAFQQRLRSLVEMSSVSMSEAAELELDRFESEAWLFDVIEDPPRESVSEFLTAKELPAPILHLLQELFSWGSQVHLPLTLELMARWRAGVANAAETSAALLHVLSYLVRRALCAIPTNNLNRIFSSLPVLLVETKPVDTQLARLLSAEQRYWPTDRQVLDRCQAVPLQIGSRADQVRYILTRLEAALSGDPTMPAEAVGVHPVIPAQLTPQWREYLAEVDPQGPEEAATKAHTLGNLALVPLNLRLGATRFDQQREILSQQHAFRVNEDVLAAEVWTSQQVERRAVRLAEIALAVWPRVSSGGGELVDEPLDRVLALLLAIPEQSWTTVESLAEVLALRTDAVMTLVDQSEPVLAVKVLGSDGRLPEWAAGARRDSLEKQLEDAGYDLSGPLYEDGEPLGAERLQELLERTASRAG